jgi:hypothetical protein
MFIYRIYRKRCQLTEFATPPLVGGIAKVHKPADHRTAATDLPATSFIASTRAAFAPVERRLIPV